MYWGEARPVVYETETVSRNKGRCQAACYGIEDIISKSSVMEQVKNVARAAALCDANVMITGASGTGKELLAQGIHRGSRRAMKPVIAENCAAIPENLMESTLFGTAKGGFTGAADKPGLFQLADGGTLILDEINSLGVKLQAKLLRVLQEGCFRPVGTGDLVHVDVRIISIANEDPKELIRAGRLREDLFYRLSVIDLFVPPLKKRAGDIPLLAAFFLNKFSKVAGKHIAGFSTEVMEALLAHDWEGNVRELSNVIECGVSLTGENQPIEIGSLPHYFLNNERWQGKGSMVKNQPGDDLFPQNLEVKLERNLTDYMASVETTLITEALKHSGGNITKAAGRLGITRQALQHKLRKMEFTL